MQMVEIKSIAKSHGINVENMKKSELVRAIQKAEGNEPCFVTDKSATCCQTGCCWYENCSVAAETSDTLSAEQRDCNSTNPDSLPSNYSLQEAVQLAFQYCVSGNLSGTRSICDQLLADKIENFYVYYLSGIVASQINDPVLARKHLQSALALSNGGTAERIADVNARLQMLAVSE